MRPEKPPPVATLMMGMHDSGLDSPGQAVMEAKRLKRKEFTDP
jgi:hypothetical protein